jgi:hypothetical protein
MNATPADLRAMTRPFKPLAGITAPLRGLLIAALVADIAAVFADLYAYVQYSRLPAGSLAGDRLLESDGLSGLVGLAQFGCGLAAFILFLIWIHRANGNLRRLSGETLTITPGWAVGWFFIPVASLWMPYLAVKEIWEVSHRGTGRGTALVGWWWAAMIATSVTAVATTFAGGDRLFADDVADEALAWEFADGALAVMHVVTLLLVGAVAAAYARRVTEPPAGTVMAAVAGYGATGYGGAAGDAPGADLMRGVNAVPSMGGTAGMVPVQTDDRAPEAAPASAASWAVPSRVPAAWYPDPLARHELRWWDGDRWTAYVADGGVQSQDPV